MRHLPRLTLPDRVERALDVYQAALDRVVARESRRKAPRIGDIVEAEWKRRRGNLALEAAARALRAMASGDEHCMYCEGDRGCDLEHLRSKVRHPGWTFRWLNLLLICAPCNRQKSERDEPDLLDPTKEDPLDHLALSFSEGRYRPLGQSPQAAATLRAIPRLEHDPVLTRGRQRAWTKLRELLEGYETALAVRDSERAARIRDVVTHEPFSAVFAAAVRAASMPGAVAVLGSDFTERFARIPGLAGWLDAVDAQRRARASADLSTLAGRIRLPPSRPKRRAAP